MKKGDYVWVTHLKYPRVARTRDDDRSGACEEGYAVICTGCEGGERGGTRPLRPLCLLYCVKSGW